MTSKSEELITAAFKLSQAAPVFWSDFIKAFGEYATDVQRKLMSAEPQNLINAQGQAVQAVYIAEMLANCRQTMQKAEQKRSLRKPPEVNSTWLSK